MSEAPEIIVEIPEPDVQEHAKAAVAGLIMEHMRRLESENAELRASGRALADRVVSAGVTEFFRPYVEAYRRVMHWGTIDAATGDYVIRLTSDTLPPALRNEDWAQEAFWAEDSNVG